MGDTVGVLPTLYMDCLAALVSSEGTPGSVLSSPAPPWCIGRGEMGRGA